jgi:hypothetical protein
MTAKRTSRAARRERAKKTLEMFADHATACLDACKAHHEACFEILEEIASGTYTPQRYFADVVALTLDCYGTFFRCICPEKPEENGTIFQQQLEPVLEIDQRSEMGGPLRMLALDEVASSVATRITMPAAPLSAFPAEKISLRTVKGGEAWVALIDFAAVVLAPGDYPVDVNGETLLVRKADTAEGTALFAAGTLPPELLADPSLNLRDVVGATPPNL